MAAIIVAPIPPASPVVAYNGEVIVRENQVIGGIVAPVPITARPVSNRNEWSTAYNAADWTYRDHNRTVQLNANSGMHTIYSLYGYISGVHVVDVIIPPPAGGRLCSFLGIIPIGFAGTIAARSLTAYQVADRDKGFSLSLNDGELYGGVRSYLTFGAPILSRVRFVIDFNARLIEIWYNNDEVRRDKLTFTQLNLPVGMPLYVVYCSQEPKPITINAALDGTCDPFLTEIIDGIVYPAGATTQPLARFNEWLAGSTDWKYSNNNRSVSCTGARAGTWYSMRTMYGYIAGSYHIDFSSPSANLEFGMVTTATDGYNRLGSASSGFSLIWSHHEVWCMGRKIAKIDYDSKTSTVVKRVRFAIDLTTRHLAIWYDDIKQTEFSMEQLSLPRNEPIYAAISSSHRDATITIDASLQSGDKKDETSLPARGWSENINDYDLIERLAQRAPNSLVQFKQFYGSNAAVYCARLKRSARERSFSAYASHLASMNFALKIVYSLPTYHKSSYNQAGESPNGALNSAQHELDMFRRLPRHNHIVRIEHYFVDKIPTRPLPIDWTADMTVFQEQALFIVMDQCRFSLQEAITHRKEDVTLGALQSLFRPEEVLLVASHISSALILLNKELVAHRDLKPDNILVRLPFSVEVTDKRAKDNLCQTGLRCVLADFGELFDFKAHECKQMVASLGPGMLRGGAAYTMAPEISFPSQKRTSELNYEKADVWSLGVVLATMLSTKAFLASHTDMVMNAITKQLLPGAIPWTTTTPAKSSMSSPMVLCKQLITNMLTLAPADRWSCHDVHRFASPS